MSTFLHNPTYLALTYIDDNRRAYVAIMDYATRVLSWYLLDAHGTIHYSLDNETATLITESEQRDILANPTVGNTAVQQAAIRARYVLNQAVEFDMFTPTPGEAVVADPMHVRAREIIYSDDYILSDLLRCGYHGMTERATDHLTNDEKK